MPDYPTKAPTFTVALPGRLAAVLAVTIAAGAASANPERTTWDPPARYAGPYTGELTVIVADFKRIPHLCRQLFIDAGITNFRVSQRQRGCAHVEADRCTIVIPRGHAYGSSQEAVMRHELGHCAGWPADHPEE
jgi:hypothetical protein